MTGTGDWVTPRRGFLLPVKALSRVVRGKFVAALKQEYAKGRPAPVPDRAGHNGQAWRGLLSVLYRQDWVV